MAEEADVILAAQQAIEQTKRLQSQVDELTRDTKAQVTDVRRGTVQRSDLRAQLALERARMVRQMYVWISAAVVFAVVTAMVSGLLVNAASRGRAKRSLDSCTARDAQISTLQTFFREQAATELQIHGLDPAIVARRAKAYEDAGKALAANRVDCKKIFHEGLPVAGQPADALATF